MVSTPIRRTYSNFRGVDFANDPSLVLLSRSPDALNVWRNYQDTQGSCIETRPGYRAIVREGYNGSQINGIYFYNNKLLYHEGTSLYYNGHLLTDDMNNEKSSFAIFKEKLYIVDGANYLVFDGETLKDVSDDDAYIPTTTMSRLPSGRRRTISRCQCVTTIKEKYIRSRWNINRLLSRYNEYNRGNRGKSK